jgi:hypothetical protein
LDDPIAPIIEEQLFCLRSLSVKVSEVTVPYKLIVVLSFEITRILNLVMDERNRQIVLIRIIVKTCLKN